MSEAAPNNQTIIQYLLADLPEAETERLDELSFTSDEFAETLNATEKDLVDAYVQGELSGETLKDFENRYLGSARLQEKVVFAEALKIFSEQTSPQPATNIKIKTGWFSALSAYLLRRPVLQWGLLAAGFALLFTAVWFVIDNVRLRRQIAGAPGQSGAPSTREQDLLRQIETQRSLNAEREAELARSREEQSRLEQELAASRSKSARGEPEVFSFVLTAPLRGTGQLPTVKVPPGTKRISAQLGLEGGDYSNYRIALVNASGTQVLWTSGNLKPGSKAEHKTLNVIFAANLLQSQNYVLRVNGLVSGGGSEIVGDYPFRVMR